MASWQGGFAAGLDPAGGMKKVAGLRSARRRVALGGAFSTVPALWRSCRLQAGLSAGQPTEWLTARHHAALRPPEETHFCH